MTDSSCRDQADRFPPLVRELVPAPDPVEVFRNFSRLPHCLFLDSAMRDPALGRYSFITADPFDYLQIPTDGSDGLHSLSQRMAGLAAPHRENLPPFQGGAAGLFAYDLNRSLERLPSPRYDEFEVPALAVGLYDVVLAFDHLSSRAWLISQGLPECDARSRQQRATARASEFLGYVQTPPASTHSADNDAAGFLRAEDLSVQFPIPGFANLTSNFTAEQYRAVVGRAIEYVHAGDVFQVNVAQRLLHPALDATVRLYERLRKCNPAPFAGFFDLGVFQIASASPERFLSMRNGFVESRPIKGTRQRCRSPEADLFAGGELLTSEKDRAENVMIVDLLRNDISRVCLPDSVRVTDLCRLEVYQYVQHLVSVIQGQIDPACGAWDLIRAAFPGGSITGAPKVRAMEIISELETTARGAYCGSLGYVGFDGTVDLSILIRTITAGRGWWQLPVGGGIVAQSAPQSEYDETWHKAVGLIRALK